ncbi:MAG: hypothetical protein F6K23_35315 [Okeania sp. SIO2C9]|uniref:hypothetical protein n=1 Tax=Okeania sp. SIO2C9 TaxID=2607791 RepID=UPI0013C2323C|nr:hypothetical protein [Okeania sp. SIO2C9]NEQ77828.1 hypothetical protein [Okeania sp. SIO2C9]
MIKLLLATYGSISLAEVFCQFFLDKSCSFLSYNQPDWRCDINREKQCASIVLTNSEKKLKVKLPPAFSLAQSLQVSTRDKSETPQKPEPPRDHSQLDQLDRCPGKSRSDL